MGVGLFGFLHLGLAEKQSAENTKEPLFTFPEVTFFWEKPEFQERRDRKKEMTLKLPEVTFFWEKPEFQEWRDQSEGTAIELPEVTFFWQKNEFQPNYGNKEALQIPHYPSPTEERLAFESIDEPTLSTDRSAPDFEHFETQFLKPLDSFLVPSKDSESTASEDHTLSLHQALHHAFASNPSVQVNDLQIAVEDERLKQAESIFTPNLELSSEYGQSRFPQNAAETSANNLFPIGNEPRRFLSKTGVIEAAITGEGRAGTQYEVYTNLSYNESTLTRTSNSALHEQEYTTNFGIRLTQPILRGSSRTVREAPIRVARINREIATADLQTELTVLAGQTLEAYYRWIESAEVLKLRQWERRTYNQLAEIIRRKVETGDASSREHLRVEIRLTRIEDRIFQAEEQLNLSRNRLFAQFGQDFQAPQVSKLRPTGELSPEIPTISEQATIQAAWRHSAEISSFRKRIEIDRENLGVALDETRPTLNLVGGVEVRGLDESPTSSVDYLYGNQPVGYNIGLIYSRPWGNHGAEARVRENRLSLRQNGIELDRIKQEIRQRIIGEIERLGHLRDRRDNIAKLQAGIGEEIEKENHLLETGQTTLGTLLEFYEELFQVRAQYLAILSQINEAKVRLWAADQSLLKRLGVDYYNSID
ncbi:MAG: TolC family protein [Opitutaceae bacterium]